MNGSEFKTEHFNCEKVGREVTIHREFRLLTSDRGVEDRTLSRISCNGQLDCGNPHSNPDCPLPKAR